jgi:hypothetical protein
MKQVTRIRRLATVQKIPGSNPVMVVTLSYFVNERYLLHVNFLLGLFFYPKDGGDISLRNVG